MHSPIPSLAQARPQIDACRAALRAGSSSFHAASLLLPARVRRPASALYAFCRLADDAVDQGTHKAAAVQALRDRLASSRAGRCTDDVDVAFAAVVAHFGIPWELPQALVEGFAWDAASRRYEDLPDLLDYAARVAGSVGVMMALVMGARTPTALARASDLGVAMQLSNIARDVGEDARAGRLYLPQRWMREEGIDPQRWMRHPAFEPALGRVVARLLSQAQELYGRSRAGLHELPIGCRPGIAAARLVYGEIGAVVGRQGLDSVATRAVVTTARKLALVARAALEVLPGTGASHPPLPANQFLLDAVLRPDAAARAEPPQVPGGGRGDSRAAWLADLFGRLAREERLAASQPVWR